MTLDPVPALSGLGADVVEVGVGVVAFDESVDQDDAVAVPALLSLELRELEALVEDAAGVPDITCVVASAALEMVFTTAPMSDSRMDIDDAKQIGRAHV